MKSDTYSQVGEPENNKILVGGEVHLRYEALFHNSLDGIFIYNYVSEKIVECNSAAVSILGFSHAGDVLSQSRFEFIPKTDPLYPGVDLHKFTDDNGSRVKNGEAFNTYGVFNGFEGRRILVRANVVPTFYEEGEAFIIFKDVTDKVLNKKALKKSESRYRDVYKNSNEGIIYIDSKSLDIIMCNDKALHLFGANDIQEFRKVDASYFHPDDENSTYSNKRLYIKIIMEARETGRSEFSFWLKNLKDEHVRIEGVMVSDTDKSKNRKLISFIRDVTELYETQGRLFQKNEELEDYITSNLQLENFAYLASHDLKTPLRSIISFTQLLERRLEGRMKPSEQQLFDYIKSAAESMGEIIKQLLEFSKVEHEILKRSKIKLEILYNQLLIEMASDIKDTNAIIDFDLSCHEIVADRSKLKQVLRNLISNSLKFAKRDTSPIIRLKCIEKPSYWLFSISDNGIGIEVQYQESIFAMFKRLHANGQYEGVGIGLPMCKKIVEQHHGTIWVESIFGEGSTFRFNLAKRI